MTGSEDHRVQVQLAHPSAVADVTPAIVSQRFVVSVVQAATTIPAQGPQVTESVQKVDRAEKCEGWLADLPTGSIRSVFAHLDEHGVITENEIATKLGSPRAARKFAREFDEYARLAPFSTRIDSINGVKRYTKDGDSA